MLRKLTIVMLVLLFVMPIEAADFEHREIGVRAQGMGNVLTAESHGVASIYSNPAGLAGTNREFFITYSDLFGIGLEQSNFAYAQPFLGGGLGFAYEKISNSEDLFYEVTTFQLSYGRAASILPVNYGFTIRKSGLDSEGGTADAISLDFGLNGRKGNFAWGLAVFNGFAATNPASKQSSAPLEVKIGAAYRLRGTFIAGELVNGKELRLGVERAIGDNIAVRAGYKDGTPAFGLGLKTGPLTIDYSLELGALGYTNALGLTRQF